MSIDVLLRRGVAVVACFALTACDTAGRKDPPPTSVNVRVANQIPLRTLAIDTLSESATLLKLLPSPDGRAVAFTFADSLQGISQGLGIVAGMPKVARLGWPDSVGQVAWSGPNTLTFTAGTGIGVYVILDVQADSLIAVRDSASTDVLQTTGPPDDDSTIRARATRFIDSVRTQPEGIPQGSRLRYMPTKILQAPHDSVAAFHVTAFDERGQERNPAWYLLDRLTGSITALDSLTGLATLLPRDGAAWAGDSTFYFAKDLTLVEVHIQRR